MAVNYKNDELEENENIEEEINDSENGSEIPENVDASDIYEDQEQDRVQEEIEKLKNDIELYKNRLLRTSAEYDNFRKRTEKEKLGIYMDATSKAVLNILPVADSLDLAEKSCEGSAEDYKKGLSMVKSQFSEALKNLGVKSFGEVGDKFNPDIHNAVSHIDDESDKENMISEVFQKGYILKDRVIRHAMVQVTN